MSASSSIPASAVPASAAPPASAVEVAAARLAAGHAARTPVSLVPEGVYPAEIAGVGGRPGRDGAGLTLEVVLRIAAGPHAGRVVRDYITMRAQNNEEVQRGGEVFAELLAAAGFTAPPAPAELIGRRLQVVVGVSPARDRYPARNRVWAYHGADAEVPAAGAPAAPAPAAGAVSWDDLPPAGVLAAALRAAA